MKKLIMALAAIALVGVYAQAAPDWNDPSVTTWVDGGAPDVSPGVEASSDIESISWYYDTDDGMVYFRMDLYGDVDGNDFGGTAPTSNTYQWYIDTDSDSSTGANWSQTDYIAGNTEGLIQDPHDGYPQGIDRIPDVHTDIFGGLNTYHYHTYDPNAPLLFDSPVLQAGDFYFTVSGSTIVYGISDDLFTAEEMANVENWVVWGGTQNLGQPNGEHDVSPIPEPSTYALVGLGVAAIAIRRRLRRG